MYHWHFEWITDWDTIWSDNFIARWKVWYEKSPSSHIFFHPSLVQAWLETYLPIQNIQPFFLVAREGNTTVFLPLLLWKRNWKNAHLRELITVGFSDFDYHDPVIAGSSESLESPGFWTTLITELNQKNVFYDRLNINGITKRFATSDANWTDDEVCLCCNIDRFEEPEEFLPTLKKSLRGDLKRQVRRLGELGKLTYYVYDEDALEQAIIAIPQFLATHSRQWPKAYKAPHLHENLLKFGLPEGLVHFSELRLDDRPISWHLGFLDKKRFYYYLPTADPSFARFSPAKVHLLKCVEDAIRLKLQIFDHLRGGEPYKTDWTDSQNNLYKLRVVNDRFTSRLKNFMVDTIKPQFMALR